MDGAGVACTNTRRWSVARMKPENECARQMRRHHTRIVEEIPCPTLTLPAFEYCEGFIGAFRLEMVGRRYAL